MMISAIVIPIVIIVVVFVFYNAALDFMKILTTNH